MYEVFDLIHWGHRENFPNDVIWYIYKVGQPLRLVWAVGCRWWFWLVVTQTFMMIWKFVKYSDRENSIFMCLSLNDCSWRLVAVLAGWIFTSSVSSLAEYFSSRATHWRLLHFLQCQAAIFKYPDKRTKQSQAQSITSTDKFCLRLVLLNSRNLNSLRIIKVTWHGLTSLNKMLNVASTNFQELWWIFKINSESKKSILWGRDYVFTYRVTPTARQNFTISVKIVYNERRNIGL